ncbi:hypothetical protein B0J18DRAFT_229137 [Chaetomium sp. MPI-SDFR-AT-0129]|nr:hypothetical protein B0J18DRAFT_229137 [Chaetomium sp. MPI-SDFR-AT-0129]
MNGSLTFSPNRLVAQPGEFVQFQFHAGNHTVTQSTFDQPCQPINQHNSSIVGFHSGFLPAAASAAQGMIPTYTIQVNNTQPLWLYCAQGKHCENGMVMVINEPAANKSRTLESFKALAAGASTVVPGGAAGAGGTTGTGTTGGTNPSGTGAPASASSPGAAGVVGVPGGMALAAAGMAAVLFL